jgi:aminoglycoside phosphotransferase (APT) family kinase protein
VHPSFGLREAGIGGIQVPSLQTLVEHAHAIESTLHAPFSVLTHGDFNIDNVIFTRDSRIRFIDLHRSKHGDYVQDVSVFIASNLRLQIFESVARRSLHDLTLAFYDFAGDFAQRHDDPTYTARLGLGLARSFITSTRFLLDEGFAKSLYLRARYLLERIAEANTPEEIARFTLPKEVLLD